LTIKKIESIAFRNKENALLCESKQNKQGFTRFLLLFCYYICNLYVYLLWWCIIV